MCTELAQINPSRHLRIFHPSMCKIYFFYKVCSSCLKLSCGRCSSLKVQLFLTKKISPWSFKKNNEQRMQSLSSGELNIILAIQSVDFSGGKNATYYSLSWPHRGNIWNCQKGAFLLFQINEK